MRNLYLILSLLFLNSLFAQNNLRLYTASGEVFKAYLDGQLVNHKPEASLSLSEIKRDTVKIKVEMDGGSSGEGLLYLIEKGRKTNNKEFNYQISEKNGKVSFIFSGTQSIIRLPQPLVPAKPVVDTSYKLRDNVLGHYCELKEGKAIYYNNIPANGECISSMPPVYVTYLHQLMSRAQTEDDKFTIAENTCRNNCVTVSQLNKILSYIPYEIEKLKLIKTAYFSITDKNNRSKLDSTFKLESSRKELANFLKNADAGKIKTGIDCKIPSPENEITALANALSVYSNDTERFHHLKKIYQEKCFSAAQVKILLFKFIHDREKLDAAKLLYYFCTEKENYTSITEVFSYNTSVSDLTDFISKQKQ